MLSEFLFRNNISLQLMWQEHKRETRFTSQCPPKEIITKIAEAARPLGFDIQKKNYKVSYVAYCLHVHIKSSV
jgi:hypothetical protein